MKLCVLFLGVFVAMATAKPQYSKKDIASLLERILSTRMGNGNGEGPLQNFPAGNLLEAIKGLKEAFGDQFDGDVPVGVKQAFKQFVVAARAAIAERAATTTTEATTEAATNATTATESASADATTATESASADETTATESASADETTATEATTPTSATSAPERRQLLEKLLLLALDNKMKSKRSHNY